ncbi:MULTISPECIES: substrate-binding domain-containing protein [unclassified Streptomyces]|uniref:substrate-binding domain-containing protein n=1 Tax=unclassified Streptomyces TaxID=2593676 RepID=UPI0020354A0A|nr:MULTISPECIES: substrate-binding domain-containing protein [unclassified Streptomyces]
MPASTVPVSFSCRSCHAVPAVCIRSTEVRLSPSNSRYSSPAPHAPDRIPVLHHQPAVRLGDLRPGDIWVDNDHAATTREVLDHLAAAGARRIALHCGFGDEYYTYAVTRAYLRWCAERGSTPLLIPFEPEDAAGHAFDRAFLGRDADAVYSLYDPGGRQVLAAAARHGLRVLDQLLLVCASEDPAYAQGDPAVSAVTLRPGVIGETAVASLVALLESPRTAVPGQLTVAAGLTVRASSRAASAAPPGAFPVKPL